MPTLNVNGVTLYYEDEGPRHAPALLLCHSLFFDNRMFKHQAAGLSDRLRVIRYDYRDQGRSSRSDLAEVDMDTLSDDAAALIEALELERCYVAGNSMGGFVALRLAARRPDLVSGCIVMGSSGEAEYKLAEFKPLVDAMAAQGTAPVVDTLMYIMFGDASLADPEKAEERAFWRQYMHDLGPDIARSAYGVINRPGVLDELTDTPVPILVLAGEQDHAYEAALSRNIAGKVKRGYVQVVPQAGHSVALEQPQIVNRYIAEFIAAH